jgi:hypothetical protein
VENGFMNKNLHAVNGIVEHAIHMAPFCLLGMVEHATYMALFYLFSLGRGRETRSGIGGTSSRIPRNKISEYRIEMHMFAVAVFPQIFSAFVRRLQKLFMREAGFLFQLYEVISPTRIPIKI